jgi:hypothetical protein
VRTMYDSITAADIPAYAQLVGGYVNGTFQWSAADWARFPTAVHVRFATRANINDGHVLDVEKGDATPDEAPGWVTMRRAAGIDPSVYCNTSDWPAVRAAFTAAGVPEPHYMVAHYDGVANIPAGAVAKQYINDPDSGGHYDLTCVADYWPGIDPGSAPIPHQEDEMAFGRVCPAGTNEHADMSVVGCSKLRIHDSFGHTVHVHDILFYGDSGSDPNGTGVGGGYAGSNGAHWDWVSNRPGPLAVPAGATTVTVLYDSDHDFYLSAAAA